VPAILNTAVHDEIFRVRNDEAFTTALLVGISSGAACVPGNRPPAREREQTALYAHLEA
jgi:cysteine synthase